MIPWRKVEAKIVQLFINQDNCLTRPYGRRRFQYTQLLIDSIIVWDLQLKIKKGLIDD